jgi:hypothetical protein
MKRLELVESYLKNILKKVINEQLVSDYNKIQQYLDNLGGKKTQIGDSIKYEFQNADGLGIITIKNKEITVYNNKILIGKPTSLEELKRMINPEV